jgi:outer membrane protein
MHRWLVVTVVLCAALLMPAESRAADLLEVFAQAQQNDSQYSQVQASARATLEQYPQARAQLLPFIDFTYTTQKNYQHVSKTSVGSTGNGQYNNTDWSANLTQPVFHIDRIISLGQADDRIAQAQAQVDFALQDLIVRTASRYFDVLAALDTLEYTRAARRSLGRQLEQARKRFEVGVSAITDVQEAKAGYDRARAAEISAENDVDNAREALREVTANYYKSLAPLKKDIPLKPPEPDNIDEWTRVSAQQNLQIEAARYASNVARQEIRRVATEGWLPGLDVVASYGHSDQGGDFSQDTNTGSVGIQLNVPIFSGLGVVSRTRESRALYQQALDQLTQQQRAAQRETRESYNNVVSGISSVKALEQAVVSSETSLEATQAGFDVGTRTAVDVVAGEQSLAQARRDLAVSRYDYIVSTLRLKRAAGTLRPRDLQIVNNWLK